MAADHNANTDTKGFKVMGYWWYERRHDADFPGCVISLGVPMSPVPHVPRHRTGHIRGLISTERTHTHENPHHTFCVLAQLT
jgi:hypothetical protein